MKTLSKFNKICIISLICILVIGAAMISFFGFNASAENVNGYALSVKAEENIGDAAKIIAEKTDAYCVDKSIKPAKADSFDDGGEYVLIFTEDVSESLSAADVKALIKEAFNGDELLKNIDVTVSYTETVNADYSLNALYLSIAAVISLAFVFVYTLFAEKLAGALSVLFSGGVSALAVIAAIGIARVPVDGFLLAAVAVAALLSSILSLVLVNRFGEELKLMNTDKPDTEKIVEIGLKKGTLRIYLTSAFIAAFGVLLIAFGLTTAVKWAGLQIIVASIISVFVSVAFTGIIWTALKPRKKRVVKEVAEESAE